ncbi:hypothetical protein [Burkholderia lata]|uniref:hypothetical protein n=1 Tax=Burkholderia lata (strain ATCC 17760 / DSM 23089 / LMG 22485 / NCIMB 9086 / R18194 / 383) TaxID=482957 RepID=UPI001452CF70|nr:hypothetical protein [Burkholderia lata]VWM20556.1 hypothetical protein BLA6992_07455 [Burkholderia lata]
MANRQPDAAGLLAFFWDRFDASAASDEDLAYLSVATDEAANAAFKLSAHIAGLACLIDGDRGIDDKPQCGSLQDADQTALLYRIADEVEAIARMAHVGGEAESILRFRLMEKLATSNSRRVQRGLQSSPDKAIA